MKYRKLYKRLIAFTLCITIGIQSFFSSELPVYAGQSTPSAIDSLEGLLYEDSIDTSGINMYDDTGMKLIPLSSEALRVSKLNAPYDDLNPVITDIIEVPQTRSAITIGLGALIGAVLYCLIPFLWGVSKKAMDTLRTYWVNYSYPSHLKTFTDVEFSFINSDGLVTTEIITQQMMENLGKKLEAYEAGRIWEVVFLLTDEDKLCLTYTMYKHGYLTNLKRENINITRPVDEIVEKYPYYIMAGSTTNMWQVCFDKKPIGSFLLPSYTKNYSLFDYDGNKIYIESGTIFYSGYRIKYDNGNTKLLLDICNTCVIPYKLNETAGYFDSTNTILEYVPKAYSDTDETLLYTGFRNFTDDSIKQFPFHYYKALRVSSSFSDELLKAISSSSDYEQSSNQYDFNIVNIPHTMNIEDYYNALPRNLSIRKEFDINSPLNLDATTSYLNPTGVRTWDGAIEKPTEIPTESVKPSESVQPSEGTGGDSGTVTITLSSILTKLSNLFDWIKTNLTASAFAIAVVSALGLTALFQTITTPLSSLLNYAISISGKVADIASWDINAWIGALAAPLSHLLDIDNLVSDIANWDIDALINAVPKFLSIDTTLSTLAKVIGTWNFADWPMSMAQTLRDVLTHPLSALQTATDAIAKALDNVATWDLKTALKALENAITGALTGALTVAGITSIIDILTNIKDIALEAVGGSDDNSSDSNTDNDFFNFAKLLYILIAIIILLIILFLNCLRFIILIFSIPASTAFLNEDILKGIEYVKNLQVEKFNLSLYDIIVGVVYFLLFLAIIKAIRNKIDKIHI